MKKIILYGDSADAMRADIDILRGADFSVLNAEITSPEEMKDAFVKFQGGNLIIEEIPSDKTAYVEVVADFLRSLDNSKYPSDYVVACCKVLPEMWKGMKDVSYIAMNEQKHIGNLRGTAVDISDVRSLLRCGADIWEAEFQGEVVVVTSAGVKICGRVVDVEYEYHRITLQLTNGKKLQIGLQYICGWQYRKIYEKTEEDMH